MEKVLSVKGNQGLITIKATIYTECDNEEGYIYIDGLFNSMNKLLTSYYDLNLMPSFNIKQKDGNLILQIVVYNDKLLLSNLVTNMISICKNYQTSDIEIISDVFPLIGGISYMYRHDIIRGYQFTINLCQTYTTSDQIKPDCVDHEGE